MRRLVRPVGGLATLLVVLVGCATEAGGNAGDAPFEKRPQTWTKPYEKTTCTEFKKEMTETERWTAAADLLIAERSREERMQAMPSKLQVEGFAEGLASSCTVSDPIDQVAVAVYESDPTTFSE